MTKESKKGSKPMYLIAHPYGAQVALVNSPEGWARLGKELDIPADECNEVILNEPAGITVRMRGTICVGVFDGDLATLVHELVHVGIRILKHVGIKPASQNGEPLAYLVDNLYARAIAAGFKP